MLKRRGVVRTLLDGEFIRRGNIVRPFKSLSYDERKKFEHEAFIERVAERNMVIQEKLNKKIERKDATKLREIRELRNKIKNE